MALHMKQGVGLAVLLGFACFSGVGLAAPFVKGDIFASTGNGDIQHYNQAGVLLDTLNNGVGGFTTGSAFDSAGNLYLTNFGIDSVSKFAGPNDPHTRSSFGSGYQTPESIVFASNGHVLVGNVGGGIIEFDGAGNVVKTIVPGVRVDWFDLAADQDTILFTQEDGAVRSASRSTGLQGPTFSTNAGEFALRILAGGDVLVANDSNIVKLNSAGAIVSTWDISGVNDFFALNLDPNGTDFWSGSISTGVLYRFSLANPGLDTDMQQIDTGCGNGCLFGVSLFGEITASDPGDDDDDDDGGVVPEPGSILLLAMLGLAAAGTGRKRKQR